MKRKSSSSIYSDSVPGLALGGGVDTIFNQDEKSGPFKFDQTVAYVFDDMISRSVPMYADVQLLAAHLAGQVCEAGDVILDLGCSTGTSFVTIEETNPGNQYKYIGVDNSEPMLKICEQKLAAFGIRERSQLITSDLKDLLLPKAKLILLNYTLQFITAEERPAFLRRVKAALQPGGILMLSEKIIHSSTSIGKILIDLHHEFKVSQGYSKLEVSNKRDSLEKVLVPLTAQENMELLKAAGFAEVEQAFLSLNFATFFARN